MDTINGLFKTECIATPVFHDGPYKTPADVEYATAGWVDWYNHRRLHGDSECSHRRSSRKPTTLLSARVHPTKAADPRDGQPQFLPPPWIDPTQTPRRNHYHHLPTLPDPPGRPDPPGVTAQGRRPELAATT